VPGTKTRQLALAAILLLPADHAWAQSLFQSAPGPAPTVRPRPAPPPAEKEPELPPPPAVPIPAPEPAATTANFLVDGEAMPWRWVKGGLNSPYQFAASDGSPPTVVGNPPFRLRVGDVLTIKYLSGEVNAGLMWSSVDARGNSSWAANDGELPFCGNFPSRTMTSYPIYLMELVGTFADVGGAIVGRPFAIGNGPAQATVPLGAVQLQLGFNDCAYWDNSGGIYVSVSGPPRVAGAAATRQ